MSQPPPNEYALYYQKYISLVPEADILGVLRSQLDETTAFLSEIPESHANVLHPPYTWTIKQVIGHITDGERIFAYRALRFARGDSIALPGFDENQYALATEFSRVPLRALAFEFETVRRATISLFENFSGDSWLRTGVANGNPISVRALAYIIAGHARHHLNIVRTRIATAIFR